ncbi:MAG TPA: M1 family metallopeptidase [Puia sp.]|nr:M1 family metallopeptidase [Puia sp.]
MIHQAKRIFSLSTICSLLLFSVAAQKEKPKFTRADTLRGSLNAERSYNVLKYDISITPDFENKSIQGKNTITYIDSGLKTMQIDLQVPLEIDSIIQYEGKLAFTREGNVFHVEIWNDANIKILKYENCRPCRRQMTIYYHGNPQIAVRPPWGGGFIFTKDSLGRPWMSVACEGTGASVWYPCKDYLGDEPDSGASLTMIVPDGLVAVANGRLIKKSIVSKGMTSWTWAVVNPINNYDIIPYIGKYVNWRSTFYGQKGNLDCSFWVLDYDLQKARKHFTVVDSMLRCFEYWFGPYPFYEDGYKLVQSPHLGMEHQSAIAYGNHFLQGYLGRDLSGTGWGLKWDFIIVHESGHEWFGNNITCKDIADEWIHESFTNYSETLYTGYYFGKEAGNDYCIGTRKTIQNLNPIIQYYGVNHGPEGTDEYYKGGNMIHTIRQVIHNDEIFRHVMRGLNQNFYHQTVTALDIQNYINKISGIDFTPVFNQYLRSTAIPVLEYKYEEKNLVYRWTNCNPDFNMPVRVDVNGEHWLKPTTEWKKEHISMDANTVLQVDRNFYVNQRDVSRNP